MKLTAGLDASGKPVAMRFHSTSPSISARLFPSIVKDGIDPFAVEGIDNYPYDTPNLKLTYQMHDTGVTPGYWRGVSHNLNAVALECFIDEMAQAAGKDPIQYRIDMLDMGSTKHQWSGLSAGVPVGARMKRVLQEVHAKSGWGKKLGAGKGMGVAVMEGYNTVIAMVAEVTVSSSYDVMVDKVTAVVDAGTLVHPDQALAQMQSTINFGQSACMWGEITIKNGGVEQTNFDMYRVARMNENPKVLDIHFIKSDSGPGGLGEPGTAVVQPAIGNAIFAACGKRCRNLPFTPENIGGA
jgi:isoquinoline 1-oxidoreductase beta subunit